MKLNVKTLRNKKFELELDANETIASMKERIQKLDIAPAESQKLIFKGKVLKDDEQVSNRLNDGDQVVVMIVKSRKKKAPLRPKVVVDENDKSASNSADQSPRNSALSNRNSQLDPMMPRVLASQPLQSRNVQHITPNHAATVLRQVREQQAAQATNDVRSLVTKCKVPPQMALQAYTAAKRDVALAEKYLTEGIPRELAAQLMKEHNLKMEKARAANPATASGAAKTAEQKAREQLQRLQAIQQKALDEQKQAEEQLAGQDTQGLPPRLAMMLHNPKMLQSVMGNPQIQRQIMGLLAQTRPELYARFLADPPVVGETKEFQKAVFLILAKTMSKPISTSVKKPNVIVLTSEDKTALTQLVAEGDAHSYKCTRQEACSAYMSCNKDVDQARELLKKACHVDPSSDAATAINTEETKDS